MVIGSNVAVMSESSQWHRAWQWQLQVTLVGGHVTPLSSFHLHHSSGCSVLLSWQAAYHSQLQGPHQGMCLWHCQLCQELLCSTDRVHTGCKGELAAALTPACQEMVGMGLEGEEKNGGWATVRQLFSLISPREVSDRHSVTTVRRVLPRFLSKLFIPTLSEG